MGAAAAVAVNPILLQLAVISRGRRRREVMEEEEEKENLVENDMKRRVKQLRVLEKFLSSMPGKFSQSERLTSDYLRCSGLSDESNQCLELLVCSYGQHPATGDLTGIERDVVSM